MAAFERTLISSHSRFDRYARGDKNALTLAEKNGLIIFIGKARCIRCHNGPNFTDNKFDNIGTGDNSNEGRFAVTHREDDRGPFKTPTLRNVALHAPYMQFSPQHNGGNSKGVAITQTPPHSHFLGSKGFCNRGSGQVINLLAHAIDQDELTAQTNATARAVFRSSPRMLLLNASSCELPLECTLNAH